VVPFIIIGCVSDNTLTATNTNAAVSPSIPVPTIVKLVPTGEYKGALTIATRSRISELDVHKDHSAPLASMGPGIVFSRLLRFQSSPESGVPNLKVECDLCRSWEIIDPVTLNITLRSEAKWQDLPPVYGRLIDPEDVISSFLRQMTSNWPNAYLLSNIDHMKELPEGIQFHLKVPDSDFLINLANGRSKILPKELLDNGGLNDGSPVGSGPWIAKTTSPNQRFEFTPNPSYFEPGVPNLERLQILVIKEDSARIAAFRNGILHVDELPYSHWETFHPLHPEVDHLYYAERGVGLTLQVNTLGTPFQDTRVRQALFAALDPWSLNHLVFHGLAYVSGGQIAPTRSWFLDEIIWKAHLNQPSRAKELLETVGIGNLPLELTIGDYGDSYLEYANELIEQFRASGFDPSLKVLNPVQYVTEVWRDNKYTVSLGPAPPLDNPNRFFLGLTHSSGRWNTTGYQHHGLDILIESQSHELDDRLREELALDIVEHLLSNGVRFMPATNIQIWAWWPQVNGLALNLSNAEYSFWSRVWIE